MTQQEVNQTKSSPGHIFNVSFVSSLLWTKTTGIKHVLVLLENGSNQIYSMCPFTWLYLAQRDYLILVDKYNPQHTQKSNFYYLP